jgi:DNA-damage-inducible protein D
MNKDQALAVFEDFRIRRVYDEVSETWLFSVVDIVAALIQQPDFQKARKYWNKLKERLKKEGSESVTDCHQLRLVSADGKKYKTDVASPETLFRIIQTVPSPRAEPIKLWLARVGYERLREYWRGHGRSEKWIQQRMMGQETRNKLTDYWSDHDVSSEAEYAILTNIIHAEWSGVSVRKHKEIKGLKTQNLRDHMTEAELIFTALAELSTRQIAESVDATGMVENADASTKGGRIARQARLELEGKTGKPVVTGESFLPPGDRKRLRGREPADE